MGVQEEGLEEAVQDAVEEVQEVVQGEVPQHVQISGVVDQLQEECPCWGLWSSVLGEPG